MFCKVFQREEIIEQDITFISEALFDFDYLSVFRETKYF